MEFTEFRVRWQINELSTTGMSMENNTLSKKEMARAGKDILQARMPSEFLAAWLMHCGILPDRERRTFEHYYGNFDTLKSERMRWAYDQQLKEATELVRRQSGLKLLEVGSGCGTESLWFSINGANVTSVDIKTDRLATARARQKLLEEFTGDKLQCHFERQNLLEMEGSDRFDLIWVQQTFHHLEPRADCVQAISRLLRPGGSIVISEVNAWNPLIQLILLCRRGVRTICHFEDENGRQVPYGNERILTAPRLKRWFQDAGLSRGKTNYYRVLPSHPVFDRFTKMERKLSGSAIVPLQTHYNFVTSKPAGRPADR